MREVNEKRAKFCADALGLEGEYEITFLGNTEFSFLLDPGYVADQLELEEWPAPKADEIETAVRDASVNVILPPTFRLIGLSNKNDKTAPRIYGVVDVQECV